MRTVLLITALMGALVSLCTGLPPPEPWGSAAAEVVTSEQAQHQQPAEEEPLSERQYLKAIEIRDDPRSSYREVKRAVSLLYAAAGIEHLSMGPGRGPANVSAVPALPPSGAEAAAEASGAARADALGQAQVAQAQFEGLTAAAVQLVLRNESETHFGALRELIYVYRDGDGAPLNPAIAHRLLQKLAELGDPEAQADLAVHLALGIEPLATNPKSLLFTLIAPDLMSALTHYAFAAAAGDPVAQMALGYRHLHGLGVPQSCQTAALYYTPVVERVIEMAQRRDSLPQTKTLRLSHKNAHSRSPSSEQEVLHYQWFADFGNADAARAVAHMLSHGAQRDHTAAVKYLRQAAEAGDADAMAHLGYIYANGIAVEMDNATAMAWFWRAAEKGHPAGHFGLGYVYMSGHGVARDYGKALKYLKEAISAGPGGWAGQADAYYYLGLMHLKGWGMKPDLPKAVQLLELGAKGGNLLAAHSLAMLHLGGHTQERDHCGAAVPLLKKVAEKGWPVMQEANEDFQHGDYEWALLNYLKAAELGQELGQSNAAWMLSEGYGYEGRGASQLALMMYKRAAEQGNMEALLQIGDGYWYGRGVAQDWARAGQLYAEAGKYRQAQALFNLGLMHQFGAGLPRVQSGGVKFAAFGGLPAMASNEGNEGIIV